MRYLLLTTIVVSTLMACSGGGKTLPDACKCAEAQVSGSQDSLMQVQCDSMRREVVFESDFQRCVIAKKSGIDTSKVHINKVDSLNGLDLDAPSDGSYAVDALGSKVRWVAKKVTATHNGTLNVKAGSLAITSGVLTEAKLVLDMSSIVVEDQSGESKTDLETHLKSDDFFQVTKHPEATFTMTTARPLSKHSFEVKGTLNIRGVSNEVTSVIQVTPNGVDRTNISGALVIDRTKFGIKYGSGQFFKDLGDKMIDDEFVVTFDLKAKK